jgi:hypothetical protein
MARNGAERRPTALVALDVGGVVGGGVLGEAGDRDGVAIAGAVADASGLHADLFCPRHDDLRKLEWEVSVVRSELLERKPT